MKKSITTTAQIEEVAAKLSTQNSHIRQSWKKIMGVFSAIESDDVVQVRLSNTDTELWLKLGEDDLLVNYGNGELHTLETDKSWNRTWDILPVWQLRKMIAQLPETMETIRIIIAKKTTKNTKLEEIINRF